MTLRAYLRDRLPYIVTYALFGLLTVAIVQLDLRISGAGLQWANLLYLWLLGLVGLLIYLAFDYRRQAAFFRRLEQIGPDDPMDELGILPAAQSLEQRLYAEAWRQLYARLRAELAEAQQRGRENVQLVSQWAHHMKTPVAVIDLLLQQARRRESDPDLIAGVAEENGRLQHSLQMLLNVVRLEDFAADFKVEQVDLMQLVRTLINDQKRAFIAHRVYPKLAEPDVPCIVQSDAKWLRFVLEQVVSNALKYASRPEGEGDGQVIFRCERSTGETVLTVSDDGIGIAPEDLGRVFAPFYTGANGREHAQSTGMGLYLARETCRRLGHQITIASNRGEGTHVHIRFPASQSLFAALSLTQR
jgi:signal transduction histidine kinase